MALNFAPRQQTTFGTRAAASSEDKPKANYWLNVGYTVEVALEDGTTEKRFVSLPFGIPLDTQEKLPMGRNPQFNQFQAARNDLLDQIIAYASTLEPGDEAIINLELQLRRVGQPVEAPKTETNPYAMKLAFTG